jgi:very-short-patch-repair endonuclease
MFLALAALLLLTVVAGLLRGRVPLLARIQRKPLMTANEKDFFARLQRALPGHLVFPQVSFAAFLTDDGKLSSQKRWAVRARFDRKIADFVVCDRTALEIVAIVELDDCTHSSTADRKRDELTKGAGFQTIRFQSKQKPTEAEIAVLFKHSEALSVSKRPCDAPRAARR